MQTNLIYRNLGRKTRSAPVLALHLLLAMATLAATFVPANPAQAATKHTDKREINARQAFAAGRYQEALDLYADLYADRVHPTYLRNIGRCYQNLKQPDKAINAFRDYLRQAKGVSTAERTEVEGYISEMEQMKSQQDEAAKASAAAAAPPRPTAPLASPPVAPNPAPAGTTVQIADRTPAEPAQPAPFYKRGWFWGVVGVAVVAGVVGGLYAGGAFSKSSIACTAPGGCY